MLCCLVCVCCSSFVCDCACFVHVCCVRFIVLWCVSVMTASVQCVCDLLCDVVCVWFVYENVCVCLWYTV